MLGGTPDQQPAFDCQCRMNSRAMCNNAQAMTRAEAKLSNLFTLPKGRSLKVCNLPADWTSPRLSDPD